MRCYSFYSRAAYHPVGLSDTAIMAPKLICVVILALAMAALLAARCACGVGDHWLISACQ